MNADPTARPILHRDLVHVPEADPDRWMLVLHGIYGAGRNWASVARRFVRARPEWGAILVDLREHGDSQGFPAPHTVDACAEDLIRSVAAWDLPTDAILGHSFGGKVALRYAAHAAADASTPTPQRIWIIDSTPAPRPPAGSAWAMLRVLRTHPGPFEDRGAGVAAVESEGYSTAVAQWMSTNLERRDDGRLVWRLDPEVMEALLRDFFDLDAWDGVEDPPSGAVVHVVKARDSSVIDPETRRRIEAAEAATGRVHLHEIDGGHWLNADNPDGLQELLVRHMPE